MSDEERFEMREWASMNGAVARQRSTRQETTMAKAGTLPEAAYGSPQTVNWRTQLKIKK